MAAGRSRIAVMLDRQEHCVTIFCCGWAHSVGRLCFIGLLLFVLYCGNCHVASQPKCNGRACIFQTWFAYTRYGAILRQTCSWHFGDFQRFHLHVFMLMYVVDTLYFPQELCLATGLPPNYRLAFDEDAIDDVHGPKSTICCYMCTHRLFSQVEWVSHI